MQDLAAMVSVSAGVRNVADLHCRQCPIFFGPELDRDLHGVPANSGNEFLGARKLPFDRPARL